MGLRILDTGIPVAEKGVADGVATLDGSGLIPITQIPSGAISNTFVVADQAERLALSAATGDVAVQTDIGETFILQGADPSVNGDWVEMLNEVNASEVSPGTFDPGAFSFLGSTIPALDSLIVDNIKIDGSIISSLTGDLNLNPVDCLDVTTDTVGDSTRIINSVTTSNLVLDGDSTGPGDGAGSIEFRDKGASKGALKWASAKGIHFDQGGINQDYTFDTATQPSIVLWKNNCVTGTMFADVSKVEFFGLAKFDPLGELTLPTLSVTSDAVISGNLTVSGSAFEQFSGEVNVSDNHFFMNAGYTAVVAQTGGMVVNYLPTATTDTVAATGFVAGVASTSNPTVITTGSATFAVGDFIQISGASNVANNGIREVLSHVGNTLTIRGVGTAGTVEDFTGTDFATDTTVAGAITKVNVSVSRAGTDGLWETANGSSTGLVFSDFLLTTAIGVTVAASGDVTASSLTMVTGKLLGRSTAATGAIEEITVGSGLSLSGGTLTATGGGDTVLRNRKTANQTFTSDTTLADLTGLSVSLLANKNYRVTVRIPVSTGAGGLKTALNGPAGSTNLRITSVVMTTTGSGAAGNKSAYDDPVGSGSNATTEHVITALIENGGTAGTLTARGAQNNSNGAGSTVQRGATIEAIEVA